MTEFDRRTPVRMRAARASEPRASDADELALSALSAPFPPAAAAEVAARASEPPPGPRAVGCGVEREDELDPDVLGQEPTTVRPRSSAPAADSSSSRASLVGLPALTAPPSTEALDGVALHVTPSQPDAALITLPDPASGAFSFDSPDWEVHPRQARRSRGGAPGAEFSWGARRGVWLALAAALFAGLGALFDRSGALDALRFTPADDTDVSPAVHRVKAPVPSVTSTAQVDEAPTETREVGAEDLVDRSKRALASGETAHLRELEVALIRARHADPANAHVRACLAEMFLRRGNYDGAFAEAVEAVHLRPKRARYRVLLGDVYRAQKNREAAEAAYAKAQELDPKGRAVDSDPNSELRAMSLL